MKRKEKYFKTRNMGKVWEAGSGLNRKGIQGKCVYKKKEGKRNKEEKQES